MKKVGIHNPTKKDLVYPLNNITLPAGKTVNVEINQANHILKTWQFLDITGVVTEVKKGKKKIKVEKKVKKVRKTITKKKKK